MGRAGLVIQNRHLAKEAAWTEHREDDFPSVFRDQHDLDLAGGDQVQSIPRIILEDDDAAFGVAPLSDELGERAEVRVRERREERDPAEDVDGDQGHKRLTELKNSICGRPGNPGEGTRC